MKPTDLKAENSDETIGRSLRRRPLARKKLSDMVEEELEQMIRRKRICPGRAVTLRARTDGVLQRGSPLGARSAGGAKA